MWSYEDAKIGMTNFLVSSQNMKAEDAELAAIQYLSEQPAWKN
ncbi:AraC family transcriptional regulator [Enterococcus faecium]|nr:AraC family transcriptional regulator [Enterococcus faecium]